MIALALSVFGASIVGSAHCAGMCGGIAAFCSGIGACSGRKSLSATAAYHASRAVSYATVGAMAGGIGVLLNAGGVLVGIQQVAAVAAGVAVTLVGAALLMQAGGIDAGRLALPAWMTCALAGVHRGAAAMDPVKRSIVMGLATPLLPCGWLWAFAVVAAGTGSVLEGSVVMFVFWAGTVPILALVGAGIASLGVDRRRMLGALAGLAMIAVGVWTAVVRAPIAPRVAELVNRAVDTSTTPACCAHEDAK